MKSMLLERWISQILKDNIDPSILLKTRFNCHIKGLHSVPIDEFNGKLRRIFFTTPDHEMHQNGALHTLSLGAHNHRYDITLTGLVGQPVNIIVQPNSTGGDILKAFKYQDGEKIGFRGITQCLIESVQAISGAAIFMPAHQVHTVYVPPRQCAAWLVEEGETRSDTVDLYSISRQPVCKFDKAKSLDQIKEFLTDWSKYNVNI